MQLRCIAVDDEPLALDVVKGYISKIPSLELIQVFDDAISAAGFLNHAEIDLIFLDINMPDINGINLLRSLSRKPMVIFTTAYKKFAYEGFELDAVDYLLKPFDFTRFSKAIQKAMDFKKLKVAGTDTPNDHIFVRSEYKLIKILTADIEYIESLEDYLRIYFIKGKSVMTLMTMKVMIEKLSATKFKRIHRSYIVAVDQIRAIKNKHVLLYSGKELPISDSYNTSIQEWIKSV